MKLNNIDYSKLLKIVSPKEVLLLARLSHYEPCTVSDKELQEFFNVQRITIQSWLKTLEEKEFINRDWNGKTRTITINEDLIRAICNG